MGCFGFVSSVGSVLRSSRGGLCLNGSENGKGGDVYVERRQRRVRLAMVFEEPKTASSDGGVEDKTDGAGVEQGSNVQKHEEETTALSQEEKLEKARAKKAEAERLEAMAEKARLDYERAQLEAEKRKLELEKLRLLRLKTQPGKDVDGLFDDEKKAAKKVEPKVDPKVPVAAGDGVDADKGSEPELPPRLSLQPKDDDASGFMSTMGPLVDMDIPKVSRDDVQSLRDHVFSMETFYVTQVETSTFGDRVVFRGNLRTDASSLLDIFEKQMKKYGLDERVRLFIMEDPASVDENRPVVIALPREAEPRGTGVSGKIFSLLFFLGSAFTSLGYGIGIFGATPQFLSQLAEGRLDEVTYTLPISLGLLGIVGAHEIGHRVLAKLRNVKLGLPIFIPSLQIGSYGSITPLRSFPKTRSDFFDVVIAGPATGMILGIGALVAGLILTGSSESAAWFPQVPTALFRSSILIGSLSKFILPAELMKNATVAVHPLAIVGYSGILINAINLIPIGRLDGGRIVQSLYGRVVAGQVSALSLLLQGLGAVFGNSPLLLFWGLVAVFFQSRQEIPCQDEVTEPDNKRSIIGLVALVTMVLVLAPFPEAASTMAGRL